jgi:hypothetical protein
MGPPALRRAQRHVVLNYDAELPMFFRVSGDARARRPMNPEDLHTMLDSPRTIRRAVALASIAATGLLAGCTDDGALDRDDTVPETDVHFVDWYGKAAEVATACNHASEQADASLDGHGAQEVAEDHNLDVVLTAGQAYEYCAFAMDGDTAVVPLDELSTLWSEGTEMFAAWLDGMAETNRSAVIVAAGNTDSLPLVGELYHNKHEADHLADEIDELVMAQAASLDLETPNGLDLYRWDPPGH